MHLRDPKTGTRVPIFNPRLDHWDDHFQWVTDGLFIVGLTERGRATVAALKLNDAYHLAARSEWIPAGLYPP
jgi:hypothetical protein